MKVYLFDSKPFDSIQVNPGQSIKPTQAPDGKWFITKSCYNAYRDLIDIDLPDVEDRTRDELVTLIPTE